MIKQLFNNGQRILYVITNVLVSSLGFAKSIVFLGYLQYYDLGLLTLLQTLIFVVGMLQIGLVSGGYRIFSLRLAKESNQVNNLIFTYLLTIGLAGTVINTVFYFSQVRLNFSIVYIGWWAGVIALYNNWLMSVFLAQGQLKYLNVLNMISNLASIVAIPVVFFLGVHGAILVVILQPTVFVVLSLIKFPALRPQCFYFDMALIKRLLYFGFVPFVTGVLYYVNFQIERWSIAYWLSTETLGKFYLVIVYSTFFALIPSSLNNLFFPKSLNLFVEGHFSDFKRLLGRYYALLITYALVAWLSTYWLMEHVVIWLVPKHAAGLPYVYAILPGLIGVTISAPIGLIFNASLQLKPTFMAYLSSVPLTIILILGLVRYQKMNLMNIARIESVVGIYICVFFYISYYFKRKCIWQTKQTLDKRMENQKIAW